MRFFGAPTNFWITIDHLLQNFLFEYSYYPKLTNVENVPMDRFLEITERGPHWENVLSKKVATKNSKTYVIWLYIKIINV